MKVIKYQYVSAEINNGTEEQPNIEQVFSDKTIPYSEANEEIAKKEAYNGDYHTEDIEDPVEEPTSDEILNTMLGVNRYA